MCAENRHEQAVEIDRTSDFGANGCGLLSGLVNEFVNLWRDIAEQVTLCGEACGGCEVVCARCEAVALRIAGVEGLAAGADVNHASFGVGHDERGSLADWKVVAALRHAVETKAARLCFGERSGGI